MDSRQLKAGKIALSMSASADRADRSPRVRIIDLERKTGEELHLCFCWNGGRDTLLEIGVEQFVGIQFRRVAGQVEDLDLVGVLTLPSECVSHKRWVDRFHPVAVEAVGVWESRSDFHTS